MKSITETAVLVSLRISKWGATKTDKDLSDKVTSDTQAERGAYRVVKELIPKRFLDPINKAAGRLRGVMDRDTLPWLHDGTGILPVARHQEFMTAYLKAKGEYEATVEDLISNMPTIRLAAKTHAGTGFDPNEIPSDDHIRSMFNVKLRVMPVAEKNDFRVKMSEEIMDAIREDYAATIDEQVRESMAHVYQRVIKVLTAMIDGLERHGDVAPGNKKKSSFHDSTIEHVHALADILDDLNVTGDQGLYDISHDIRTKLSMFGPKELRDDADLRRLAIDDAKEIKEKAENSVASFFGI